MTRTYINNEIQLCGETENGRFSRTFRIINVMTDEGASSVCYEAYHEGSSRGVLKEFYPENILSLERREDNQLVCTDRYRSDSEAFKKRCNDYAKPYKALQVMKRNESYREIAAFIPPFEIYYGLTDNSTVYIWTPVPKLLTFDKVCRDIHEHPKHGASYKFIQVIDAVRKLSRCVSELQSGGIIHRDIKPSNIGFTEFGGEIQPQTLSLFDVDSICLADESPEERIYSNGFTEPEINYSEYQPNYQTDIYSIGAVLFHALVVNDEMREKNFMYRDEYYSRLEAFVNTSELIEGAEADYGIKHKLTEILRNCLCDRERRYRDPKTGITYGCEKLTSDLDELFNDYTRGRTLDDERKNYLTDIELNSSLVLQYHLYKYPLYKFAGRNINVIVLGLGEYGRRFLDACLQAGQMYGRKLNVVVIHERKEDKDEYINARPSLADFFRIDGIKPSRPYGDYDTYGDITFIDSPDIRDMEKLGEILSLQENVSYVFIDLMNDELNLKAAALCRNENRCVSFVRENESDCENFDGIIPVYVNADVSQMKEFREIERMSFNAHLSWLSALSVNEDTLREFKSPYNHMASVANVLNVKYKLVSIDPEYDSLSPEESAKRFNAFLKSNDPEDVKKYNALICYEHRRWTTEKICDGCIVKSPEECESDSDTRDRENFGRKRVTRHVCIVRSRDDQKLHDEWNMKMWNEADESELDELDAMSVRLHRNFMRRAEEHMKTHNILDEDVLAGISSLIEKEPEALSAFQDMIICMKDIMTSGNDILVDTARMKVSHYSGLAETFRKSLRSEKISEDDRAEAESEAKKLIRNFAPVLDSMRFRDYKHSDTDLIDSIPFILTYSDDIAMAVPYCNDAENDRTKFFGNIASALMVNPSRLIYPVWLDDYDDASSFMDSFRCAGELFTRKKLRAHVEFVIVRRSYVELPENITDEITKAFGGKDRVNVLIHEVESPDRADTEAIEIFRKYFESAGRESNLSIERNKTRLSDILAGSGLYDSFAHFKFISKDMKFSDVSGCETFTYINKRPCLMKADMFNLNKENLPEFFRDYYELWQMYSKNTRAWKTLCDGLGSLAEVRDVIAEFPLKKESEKEANTEIRKYILPSVCRDSVEYIAESLRKNHVAENVIVRNYTTNSFEIVISDRCAYGSVYDSLFGNPYRLMSRDSIEVIDRGKVRVRFDNLIAEDISIPGFTGENRNSILNLIKFFHGKGFILNLKLDDVRGVMSFTYASREIKKLLTVAGRMLEVWTYHKARELGFFDDVAGGGLEIKWGQEKNLKNEIDCIVFKGFRTLFIECKAQYRLDAGMYDKFSVLSKRFGINFTPVIIADTNEPDTGEIAETNNEMRTRGLESNPKVITVWRRNEIENIGETLMSIMNGTY